MDTIKKIDGHFGRMLDKYRIEHGLTKSKLAELMGCSNHAVGKWIAGERAKPNRHEKICKELGG